MKVEWTEPAWLRLNNLDAYYRQFGPKVAPKLFQRLDEIARRLGEFPHSGRPGREDGTREAVVPRTPFIVVYWIRQDEVQILAVLDAREQWPHFA